MVSRQLPSRILIVGLGSSGIAAAHLAVADGCEVRITDLRSAAQLQASIAKLPPGLQSFLGNHPPACLDGVDLVVTSPGVDARAPILSTARDHGIEVVSEIEFAWQHRPDAPLVAVTGSNGKSTVTVLIAEMLRASGIAAVAGGNLGTPASELVQSDIWDAWVLEISSFQAEMLTALRPQVGVFLNVSQDHLERHPDIENYVAAKRRLFAFQKPTDSIVLNADDPFSADTPTSAERHLFSVSGPADAWLDGDQLILEREHVLEADEVAICGRHNLANALAASLAASRAGATLGAARRTLRTFRGLSHRHRTVHVNRGVRWVDDSKATNVGATLAALGGYDESSVHLILGGQAKGQDFSPLFDEVQRAVIGVYLIGVDSEPISAALSGAAPLHLCGTLSEAVAQARAGVAPGHTVLLAPACASFDQFSGYDERGNAFATLAQEEVS